MKAQIPWLRVFVEGVVIVGLEAECVDLQARLRSLTATAFGTPTGTPNSPDLVKSRERSTEQPTEQPTT